MLLEGKSAVVTGIGSGAPSKPRTMRTPRPSWRGYLSPNASGLALPVDGGHLTGWQDVAPRIAVRVEEWI